MFKRPWHRAKGKKDQTLKRIRQQDFEGQWITEEFQKSAQGSTDTFVE